MRLEILGDGNVDRETLSLGPCDERAFPRPPTSAAAPGREVMLLRPAEVAESFAIRDGFGLPHRRLRLREETPCERPLEGHACATRVERRTAPVVVRVGGGGADHEQDRRARGRRPDGEERVSFLFGGRHPGGVEAGAPSGIDRDREGRRPAAPVGRRCRRDRMLRSGDRIRSPDHLALAAFTGDLDPERTRRRHVEADLLTREHALGPCVAVEHPRPTARGSGCRRRRSRRPPRAGR